MGKCPRATGWAVLAGLLATALGCQPDAASPEASPAQSSLPAEFAGQPPLNIFCTTGQVADAVGHIAGEHATVSALMGPGVDPHLFRPKPSHVLQLQQADIVFYCGLHLEGRIVETLEKLAERKPVVAFTDELLASDDPRLIKPNTSATYHDPHVWHDVGLWADCTKYAASRLAEFDPDRAGDYRANAAAYCEQLRALDAECRETLASIPPDRRLLVTAHDAFAYFSAAYDLETIGLKGVSTEDEADFQHLDRVREILIERRVPTVFVESSTPPRLVNQLIEQCQAVGHVVRVGDELYSDAMGEAGSPAEEYIGMIRSNVESIARGLHGE